MFFKISSSPAVHIIVAAVIGAVSAVLIPAFDGGSVNGDVARAALYAGVAAALRALVLLVPERG